MSNVMSVGLRLKEIRENRRLELRDLSDTLRIPESVLSDIENNQLNNYFQEIYALICFYSKPVHEIFSGFFSSSGSLSYLRRDKSEDNLESSEQYIFDCINFYRKLLKLPSELVSVSTARVRQTIRELPSAVLESRAKDVISENKSYKLPVNVHEIANNLGILVVFESLPNSFYNLRGFCHKEGRFSLIGINKSHPIELQRFTLAHELHHLLYDFNSAPILCKSDNENALIERNAEKFAAELLMPKNYVQRLISHPPNIHYITIELVAKHFGVSYQAAAIRLQSFGLIDNANEACKSTYRKKDKNKTKFLLEEKLKYLRAVFGLETGIPQLQVDDSVLRHSVCGAIITDPSHKLCWHCGLEILESDIKNIFMQNPYRQNLSNLSLEKVLSVDRKKDFNQLSFNLRTK